MLAKFDWKYIFDNAEAGSFGYILQQSRRDDKIIEKTIYILSKSRRDDIINQRIMVTSPYFDIVVPSVSKS